jgi:UDP-glucose 4-epimerase
LFVVTGGAGFIGSHLADALLALGHGVRVLDNFSTGRVENLDARCEVITGDVADPRPVMRALKDADGCFHLAAISSVARANESWIETHRTNLTGTITVLDAARAHGRIPVVYASSAAVYGDQGSDPISEYVQPAPLTAYGADKLGSELHARVAYGVHGVPTMGLRMFNVYGPRQDPASPYSGVISIFARAIARRAPVTVHADGMQIRDFVFVSDVVDHFIAAMATLRETPSAAVVNVCTAIGTRIRDLATMLGEIERTAADIRTGPARAGDIRSSIGDPALAARLLGLRASVDLRRGLLATLASSRSTPKPPDKASGPRIPAC